jgi:drug/metabolite transporter (DMT)-like permease
MPANHGRIIMGTSRRRRAILALIFVNGLWGISFPVMRAINALMDRAVPAGSGVKSTAAVILDQLTRASFYSALRFAIAMAVLALVAPSWFRRLTRAEWLMGMGVGLPFAAGFLLQVAGLSEIPASRSGFLTSLTVAFTPLLVIAVERRRPRFSVLVGATIALSGTAFLTGLIVPGGRTGLHLATDATSRVGLGDALTVVAAFIFGFQIIAIDVFARRMPSERLTAGMFLAVIVVAVAVFLAGVIARPVASGSSGWAGLLRDGPFLSLTAVTSVVCSVLAFSLMNAYQPEVSPVQAASIYTLEPLFATLWAMWLPGMISPMVGLDYASERPDLRLALGGSLIILGNIVSLGAPHGVRSLPEGEGATRAAD